MRAMQLDRFEHVRLLEIPEPEPEPGQILVKVGCVSICGSDMRYYRSADQSAFPMPPGCPFHEVAGTIVESGADGFSPGDRVVVLSPNRRGGVDYLVAPPEKLVKVPATGDLAVWVMAQPLGTVLYPCESLNVLAKKVVILGQGPLGLGFTQILAGMMPSELVAVDLLDYRLEFARRHGASVCVNPGRESVKGTVDELTGGVGADVVVDTAGSSETINLALDLVRFRGLVSCFGQPLTQPIPFNYHSFSRKEVRLLPTITHARPDVAQGVVEAVDLMAKGRLDVGWMVTHRFPFAETGKAFETYANKEDDSLKVVIEF